MLRFVWCESKVAWDREHCLPGRGAYGHSNWNCISKFGDFAIWKRAFRLSDAKMDMEAIKETLSEVRKNALKIDESEIVSNSLMNRAKGKVRL